MTNTARDDIEAQLVRHAEKRGCDVDWKRLALDLLEWHLGLYQGPIASIARKGIRPKLGAEQGENGHGGGGPGA